MKGKAGPKPEMKVTSESGVTVIEESFLDGPTAEEIVGSENIIDVGSVVDQEEEPDRSGYVCSAGCSFTSPTLSGMEAHVAETGHGRAPVAEVQPELFSTPGVIHREIELPLSDELLNHKKTRLALLYQSALEVKEEKKDADSDFNARLKNIDEQMQEIARVLKKPFTFERVKCEWRILEGENARGLFRLDTNEQVDKQPLSQEDREKELEKAAEANQPAGQPCKVCSGPATKQIEGENQFVCDSHFLDGDVMIRKLTIPVSQ